MLARCPRAAEPHKTPSPVKTRVSMPNLQGSYRTPKGRIITGQELSQVGVRV